MDQNSRRVHKGGSSRMYGQGLRKRQHRIEHKEHIPNLRIDNKFPDSAENRTWASELEGRGSTDYSTATNDVIILMQNFCLISLSKFNLPLIGTFT